MSKMINKRTAALTAAALIVGGLMGSATVAWATNQGTVSGDGTASCSVLWKAKSVLDTDLDNGQDGGALAVTPDGTPTDYSNGGYVTEVNPLLGTNGIFELNHWYSNTTTPSTAGTMEYWRLPITSDVALNDVAITIHLPHGMSGVTFDGTTDYPNVHRWGPVWAASTWEPLSSVQVTDDGNDVWTIQLPSLPAKTGVVARFGGSVPAGTALTDPVYASAVLTAMTEPGSTATCPGSDPTPAPTCSAVSAVGDAPGQSASPTTTPSARPGVHTGARPSQNRGSAHGAQDTNTAVP